MKKLLTFVLMLISTVFYTQNTTKNIPKQNKFEDRNGILVTDTIIVPSVFFETDKAIIKPSFKKILSQLIDQAKEKNVVKVAIEGHTDNKGSEARNNILSELRAYAVKDFFLEKIPTLKEQITAIGRASKTPVATNDTKFGRSQNRRVQIIFTYSGKK